MSEILTVEEKKLLIFGFENIIVNIYDIHENIFPSLDIKLGIIPLLNKLKIYNVNEEKSQFSYDFSNLNLEKLKKNNFNLINEIRIKNNFEKKYSQLLAYNKKKTIKFNLIFVHSIYNYFILIFFFLRYLEFKFFIILLLIQIPIFLYNLNNYKSIHIGLKQILNLKLLDLIINFEKMDINKKKWKFLQISQVVVSSYINPSYEKNKIFEDYKHLVKIFYEELYGQKNFDLLRIEKKTIQLFSINDKEKFNLIEKIYKIKKKEPKLKTLLLYINIEKLRRESPYLILPLLSITILTLISNLFTLTNYLLLLCATIPGSYFLSRYVSKFINKIS